VEKSKGFSDSPWQGQKASALSGGMEIDRRAFGRLVAAAGAAVLLDAQPGLAAPGTSALTLTTRHAVFTIDATGAFSNIACGGRRLLAPGQPAPVLSLRAAGTLHAPNRADWNAKSRRLTLTFDDIGAAAIVYVHEKPSHLSFELTGVRAAQPVELALWGPYPLRIGDLVGEVVGVVRDAESAVGIQALNVKTLGGYPSQESDIEPDGVPADDPGIYPGLPDELRKQQNWRGDTARHTEYGSSLQAYCRNRDRSRVIRNWGDEKFVALPYDDGGVIGSKIALFAVSASEALPTLGAIEVAEGLPHPTMDGIWAKMSPRATASYLIVDFGETTIDLAIEMTQRAGLKVLYHSSPFETWGHFRLKPSLFPRGRDGFRDCVEKARRAGLGVGFHTLSNFITPNDPYVTPRPDARLAQIGTSQLTAAIDAVQTEIPVSDPSWFQQKSVLHTVMIGEELVRFESVSCEAPWRLLGCRRGAWGTEAAAHANGADAAMLMDHGYKVFLTDTALSVEVARNIAQFCNETGAVQLSLDGLEGNWSTGMGQYGCSLFTSAWYDALSPELRGHVINDASNPHHFAWHIATRYNWGEPWYAGFRQSQTLLRLRNQLFYKRNLIPPMLGWFSLRPETTREDVEWLCARAAGFDAGFALVTSFDSRATQTSASVAGLDSGKAAIFDVVRQWETARQSGAFPEGVKPELQGVNREFRLAAAGPGAWQLERLSPAGPPLRIKARAQARAHPAHSA
jgi:hypothetical protein